ncbi:hypothetical protein Ait01nite_030210 [Actinoplanes italicus]|uniref:ADP-ribosyltransferase exoenzyme n=1 Tax=Actinoplanes italicus TaxID=113567 RepID=A0A2T0KIY2_9ACTN|nr:phage minor capsid protein [Actinoplanes italicus]PRX23478.1 ADP-ribosyltransferase exoenzyme [Actinoplanes italicus]GIE29976.1 hypothetical protein Ait01nite_030210 [Actinoplanes italicus]
MAVDPDQMEEIVRETVDLYRAAEQAVLAQVTRRLAEGLDAPDWAARRLGALSTLRTSVERILTIVQRASALAIRTALAAAYRAGSASALFGIPARLLPRDPDAARAPAVLGEIPRASVIHNLAAALVRDIGERSQNVLRDVLDAYRKVIAQATAASVAGGITRREASQMAYARFVDRGLTSFADRSGRRWRLTSYVEMGVRTVTARAAVQGQTDRQQRLGLQLVIVSNVADECERCRPYEGQILRIDRGPTGDVTVPHQITGEPVQIEIRAVLENARRAGFQHPNCRHSVRAYLPGVTKHPTIPTADPEGDLARQRQRAIERNIRRWKEREQAALTPEAKAGAKARVRKWQNEMREHLKANPALKRLAYREQIGGGNLPRQRRATNTAVLASGSAPAPRPIPYAERLAAAATGQQALDTPQLGVSRRPRPEEHADSLRAVNTYTGAEYAAINRHLRGQTLPYGYEAADVTPIIARMDQAMAASTLTQDIAVHRGVLHGSQLFGDRLDGDLTGTEWREEAFLSTTVKEATAVSFASGGKTPVVMRILAPAGTPAVEASDMRLEAEVLIARGQRLRVVADRGRDPQGVRHIDVEVVTGG